MWEQIRFVWHNTQVCIMCWLDRGVSLLNHRALHFWNIFHVRISWYLTWLNESNFMELLWDREVLLWLFWTDSKLGCWAEWQRGKGGLSPLRNWRNPCPSKLQSVLKDRRQRFSFCLWFPPRNLCIPEDKLLAQFPTVRAWQSHVSRNC